MAIARTLALVAMLVPGLCGGEPLDDRQSIIQRNLHLLQHYKLIYTEDVLDYCLDRYDIEGSRMLRCLEDNDRRRQAILAGAFEQLGRQFLAQAIYDECADYHAATSIVRIGKCVSTRLILERKLGDAEIERRIYEICSDKWRRHGANAIDTCARTGANQYLSKGVLPED